MRCPSCVEQPPALAPPAGGSASDHYRRAVVQTLDQLQQIPDRPAAMEHFDSLLRDDWRREQIERSGRPVVGLLCNFVPDEIVLAAGAIPLRLDLGLQSATAAGARMLPTDVCSEIKAIVGAMAGELPYHRLIDLLVVPTACDGKKMLAQLLGERCAIHLLELPQTKDYRRSGQWHRRVRELARRIERLGGGRIRRRALRQAIELVNRRAALVRELFALRWRRPGLLSGREMFLLLQASFVADPAWWVEKTEALLEELRQREARQDSAPLRILLTGSPIYFPDFQLLQLIEQAGAEIVADEMCSGSQRLYHPTVVDERTTGGMMRAAADRTLLPCTCPCFVRPDDRIERLLELAASSGAQGVVHHTLRLCQLYDLELRAIGEALARRGLPLINIYGEGGGEQAAMVQTRIEAFFEMIAAS